MASTPPLPRSLCVLSVCAVRLRVEGERGVTGHHVRAPQRPSAAKVGRHVGRKGRARRAKGQSHFLHSAGGEFVSIDEQKEGRRGLVL